MSCDWGCLLFGSLRCYGPDIYYMTLADFYALTLGAYESGGYVTLSFVPSLLTTSLPL